MRTTGVSGRGDRIRTCDLLVPNQTRYQTALHLDGANEGTRTLDLRFTKPLLYQLSYIGASAEEIITNTPLFVQPFPKIVCEKMCSGVNDK